MKNPIWCLVVCFAIGTLFPLWADSTKLSNDASALNEPAHILSVVVVEVGKQHSQEEVASEIHQLNQMLDHKRFNGYQPLRLRLEHFESFSLEELNNALKKQCGVSNAVSLSDLEEGNLSALRSVRYRKYPDAITIFVVPGKVSEFFREQSMEPLEMGEKADPSHPIVTTDYAHENDYLISCDNLTLARSFGKYFTLPDAWDEFGNEGMSLNDVAQHGGWEKGKVDARSDRNNAMDVGKGPYYFTLSQLKQMYAAFLDRQAEENPIKEEQGSAFYLSPKDLHQLGKRYVEYQDYEKALKYFHDAAKANYANSYFGIAYLHDKNLLDHSSQKEAVKYYKKAADANIAEAQYRLGVIYEFGLGSEVAPNIETAQKYWEMAAEQGHQPSKDKLGIYRGMESISASQVSGVYSRGLHAYFDKDYVTAFKSFYLCSAHKHEKSVYFLGLCYFQGQGIPRNYAQAEKLWKSISHSAQAQNALGMIYYFGGYGVEKDMEVAYDWFSQAEKMGMRVRLSG